MWYYGGKFKEEKEEKLIAKEAKENQKKEREGDDLQMQRKVRVKHIKMRSLWLEWMFSMPQYITFCLRNVFLLDHCKCSQMIVPGPKLSPCKSTKSKIALNNDTDDSLEEDKDNCNDS